VCRAAFDEERNGPVMRPLGLVIEKAAGNLACCAVFSHAFTAHSPVFAGEASAFANCGIGFLLAFHKKP